MVGGDPPDINSLPALPFVVFICAVRGAMRRSGPRASAGRSLEGRPALDRAPFTGRARARYRAASDAIPRKIHLSIARLGLRDLRDLVAHGAGRGVGPCEEG